MIEGTFINGQKVALFDYLAFRTFKSLTVNWERIGAPEHAVGMALQSPVDIQLVLFWPHLGNLGLCMYGCVF